MYLLFPWNGNLIKEGSYGLTLFLTRYCTNIAVDLKKKKIYLYNIAVHVLFSTTKSDLRPLSFDPSGLVSESLLRDVYKNSICHLSETLRQENLAHGQCICT